MAAGRRAGEGGGVYKMDVEVISEDKKSGRLVFYLSNANPALANTIRRSIVEEVPVLAIEDIEFRNNSSVLYDEIIAHRLGLIPLTTDLGSYELPSECKCNGAGCAQCQLKLTLKEKGPCLVLASDIKSKDPKVKPVYPDMPIVKLLKGQKLEFEATAVLGQGKDHAKWSPGHVYYKHKPKVVVSSKDCEGCGSCVKSCPKNLLSVEGSTARIDKERLMECTLCEACTAACKKNALKIEPDEGCFISYIESWGQLSCREMASTSCDRIIKLLSEFDSQLKKSGGV